MRSKKQEIQHRETKNIPNMLLKGSPRMRAVHKNSGHPVQMEAHHQEYEKLTEYLKCQNFRKGNLNKLQFELYDKSSLNIVDSLLETVTLS